MSGYLLLRMKSNKHRTVSLLSDFSGDKKV